ncbi:MAG: mechanosensitive ion channel [Chromatiaceae bacterium]|nr:mechanosensitive ion channel [Chromatiaceae bacterium]
MRACLLISILLLTGAAAADVSIPDLRDIERENTRLEGWIEEVDAAKRRRETRRTQLTEQLEREELSLSKAEVSPRMLGEARLELDAAESRLAVIEGRIEQRLLSAERLRKQLIRLDRAVGAPDGDIDDVRNEVARDLLAEQLALTKRVVDSFRQIAQVTRGNSALLRERLRLLQSRLQLSALEGGTLFNPDPRLDMLESVIADHLRRAAQLGARLQEAERGEPLAPAQRRALAARADDALIRSVLRQNDLELLLAGNALDDLEALRRDESMPLHVLRGAKERVVGLAKGLTRIQSLIDAQRRVLRSKQVALEKQLLVNELEPALLDDLGIVLDFQQADIDAMTARIAAERDIFDRIIAERYVASLGHHRGLPDSTAAWGRVAHNAAQLPGSLRQMVAAVVEQFRQAVFGAGAALQWLAMAGAALLVLLLLWGARGVRLWVERQPEDGKLALFGRALARSLPAAIPAALWLFAATLFGITGDSIRAIALLLLLPPLTLFVLTLVRELLCAPDAMTGVLSASEPLSHSAPTHSMDDEVEDGKEEPVAVPAANPEERPPEHAAEGDVDVDAEVDEAPGGSRPLAPLPTSATEPSSAPARFYRKLRVGLLLATVVAGLFILVRSLTVAPILADLIDRVAMLGVLALAIPAFALRGLLERLARTAARGRRRWVAMSASISRLLPVFLLGVGLLGLVGFINLAWALLIYLAWLVVVGLLLLLVIGLLSDVRDYSVERLLAPAVQETTAVMPSDSALAASGSGANAPVDDNAAANADAGAGESALPPANELADFWRTHFVEPGYRLGVLLSFIGAGWLLFYLWGWHLETPVVRWVLGVINTRLFELGESAFTIADILLAFALVGSVFYIGGWSQQVSYNLAYRGVRDAGLRQALATFTQYVVIVAGVLLAMKIIGFDLTTLTVFAASLGVGIGFGLQNIINNFVSGILLLAERPLRVGDFVSIGSNLGNVTRIGIRSLTMRTLDKQEVIIPNGSVISGEFTNWTRSDDLLRNVHYIGIHYDDDPELAIRLIEAVLSEHPHVLKDPAPGVFLWEYADSAVSIRVQYCFRMNEGPGGLVIRSDVLLAIGRRFREQGVRIPYPQRDVRMHLDEVSQKAIVGASGALASGG